MATATPSTASCRIPKTPACSNVLRRRLDRRRHINEYDAGGRLVASTVADHGAGNVGGKTVIQDPSRKETQVTTFDARGRPLTWTQTLVSQRRFLNGTITTTHQYQYLPDESEVVDDHDGLTDVGSGHVVRKRSAGCLRIDAAFGHLPDTRCR